MANRALLRPGYKPRLLTLSGNEITDAVRRLNTQGDGVSPSDFSIGIWAAATNLVTNGGFETNTTGWTTGGTNTIARSTEQAKFGAASLKCTYSNNANLADFGITLTNAAHSASVWVYIPTAYDGGGIELRQLNFTVAASAIAANMALLDQWQRIELPNFTPGIDVTGDIQVNNTGVAPTAGRFIYVDGHQTELQPLCTPYVETDGGTAARSASVVSLSSSLLDIDQCWWAARLRPGWVGGTMDVRIASWRDAGNGIEMFFEAAGDTVSMVANAAYASDTAGIAYGGGYGAGVDHTVVGYVSRTSLGVSLDGSAFTIASRTRNSEPAATTFAIGDLQEGGGQLFDGDLLGFATGRGFLTNADAYAIHYLLTNQRMSLKPHHLPGDCTGYWLPGSGVFLAR